MVKIPRFPPTEAHCFPAVIGLMACMAGSLSAQPGPHPQTGFFITSSNPGRGADLGGLEGADAHCVKLATAAGLTPRTWKAYLCTQAASGVPGINARDRIGRGPWLNVEGAVIATGVENLHSAGNNVAKQTALNEKMQVVNGRGDSPNQHDILTGCQEDGTAFTLMDTDNTCSDWTSSGGGGAMLGHHDRVGLGANPTSWNASHRSNGCSAENLRGTGGAGFFYCFAADPPTGLLPLPSRSRPLGLSLLAYSGSEAPYRFELAERTAVRVEAYDVRGTKVATLMSGLREAGSHSVRWDGRDSLGRPLPGGIYLIRVAGRPVR